VSRAQAGSQRSASEHFVLSYKRLERGRFQLPVLDEKRRQVEMEPAQLAMLLDGIDLNARRLARWKPPGIDKTPEI
jgi:transposase